MKLPGKTLLSILVSGALTGLAACGGGGGGGGGTSNVTGLTMPDRLSVVTAKSDGTEAPKVSGLYLPYGAISGAVIADGTFADTSDYAQDRTQTWVEDESMDGLSTINMILCLMDQTKAGDMVNQGAYVALVNEDKCEEGRNESGAAAGGQSSGNQVAQLNRWVIESTRASNTAHQYVKIWIPGDATSTDPKEAANFLVYVDAAEGASATKPFGEFTLAVKAVYDDPTNGPLVTMKGTLIGTTVNSQPKFTFVSYEGKRLDPAFPLDAGYEQLAVVAFNDAEGLTGTALTKRAYEEGIYSGSSTYTMAYNQTAVLRSGSSVENGTPTGPAEACLNRDDYSTHAWRYNLYFRDSGTFRGQTVTAGQRVELDSGFPFRFTYNSATYQGNMSYWGLWIENPEIPLSALDGQTITRFEYGPSTTTTDYTAHVAPGKATLRTAHAAALTDFNNTEFYSWFTHPVLGTPESHGYNTWLVEVLTDHFEITGGVTWGDGGPTIVALPTAELIDTTGWSTTGQSLWLWSDALGGNVVYTPGAAQPVVFYSQEFVYPSDMAASSITLYCYDRCPKGGLTQTDITNGTLYYTRDETAPYTFHQYTLTLESGKVLLRDANAGANNAEVKLTGLAGIDALQSGEMVTDTTDIASQPWMIYQQPVTYRWETGNQQWNQLVTVTDAAGGTPTFDKPIQFTYVVDTANDSLNPTAEAAFNGKTVLLQYGGNGDLWGFPMAPEDPSCVTQGCRWIPGVNLRNGVDVGGIEGMNFVVKALERGQTMNTGAVCGTLDVASVNLTEPTIADLVDVDHTWAQRPAITTAPAVIEGVVQ